MQFGPQQNVGATTYSGSRRTKKGERSKDNPRQTLSQQKNCMNNLWQSVNTQNWITNKLDKKRLVRFGRAPSGGFSRARDIALGCRLQK